jgi:DNA mismatch repair protein MutS2
MPLPATKARQAQNKVITSSYYAKALQEPIITMRNDRYVVPVKAEHKSNRTRSRARHLLLGPHCFIEPMTAVEANNEIRELLAQEKKEIDRILMELSADVLRPSGEDLICSFNMQVNGSDLCQAKLSYQQNGSEPEILPGRRI